MNYVLNYALRIFIVYAFNDAESPKLVEHCNNISTVMNNNYEQHRLDTTYYNLVIRYNLKKTPGYMFRPSLGHPQALYTTEWIILN
jgi:hypothetical protein